MLLMEGAPVLISSITSADTGAITGGANLAGIISAASALTAVAPAAYVFRHPLPPVRSVAGRSGDVVLGIDDLANASSDVVAFLGCANLEEMKEFLGII